MPMKGLKRLLEVLMHKATLKSEAESQAATTMETVEIEVHASSEDNDGLPSIEAFKSLKKRQRELVMGTFSVE